MSKPPAGLSRNVRWTVLCGCLLAVSLACGDVGQAEPSASRMTPIVKAVQSARASVVNIRGEKTVTSENLSAEPANLGRRVNGMGTGVVIDPRGYIVTNYHVVDGVREIKVTLADKRQCIGRLVARDSETDLAIIKIELADKLPVIELGTSDDLMTGEWVIAVGNAYGYEHTVTRGIISALHREVQVSDAQFYDDLIQTDASINPGNSGGPLLNIDGQMIGINVAVRAGAQGIGFAIPVDKVMGVVDRLLAERNGELTRHGLVLKPANTQAGGVTVAAVDEQSPAEAAGLKPGDVITRIEDVEIARPTDFQRALLERPPGSRLAVRVRREDEPLTLELTLAAAETQRSTAMQEAWNVLGLRLERIAPEEFRRRYENVTYRGGLTVTAVRPDSPASEQGIRCGDVLVGMHLWETVSLENVAWVLSQQGVSYNSPLMFYIIRDQKTHYGHLPLSMKSGSGNKLSKR